MCVMTGHINRTLLTLALFVRTEASDSRPSYRSQNPRPTTSYATLEGLDSLDIFRHFTVETGPRRSNRVNGLGEMCLFSNRGVLGHILRELSDSVDMLSADIRPCICILRLFLFVFFTS